MSGYFDRLEQHLADAVERHAGLGPAVIGPAGWVAPWLRRRPGRTLALALLLTMSGSALAAVTLSDQRSAPVSGSLPGAVSSPHSDVGPVTYRVGVTPALADGDVGWCISVTERFRRLSGRRLGARGQSVSCGEQLGSPFDGITYLGSYIATRRRTSRVIQADVYLTTPAVAAVRISPKLTILTRADKSLPASQRVAIAFIRRSLATPPTTRPVPLNSAGQPIPVQRLPSPVSNLADYVQPGQPASPAACEINTTGLSHVRPTYGDVVQHLEGFRQVAPGTLLSCAYTIFAYHGATIDAAILLDARHPGTPPGPLPAATQISEQPHTVNQPARLTGIGMAMTARRVGNAWLVIEANGSLASRLGILDQLRTCVRPTGRPCP